ncbi:efflux RND transporter periplasmic adaptor subunit [Bosea massiliensis]|uniref:Efflux RND transporter periplasmic adaptor subunit n=1 Tax=Bosea massiliensis TaxID=151419 RepID=A0ABW0P5C4_9HYPH
MDQLTPYELREPDERGRKTGRDVVAWLIGLILVPAALAGALLGGMRAAETDLPLPEWLPSSVTRLLEGGAGPASGTDARVLYYRDPDGKPAFSPEPKKTEDGRDYLPVRVGADVSFDDKPKTAGPGGGATADASGRKVLYYRNPMGLPDTSPVPKKDSMGMDYLPVYEGEAEEGNTVKVSPGKLQRTGVRTQAAERRVVVRPVRVPGTVQLDERRVTIVSTRSDTFIEHVENVTTGERVRKGQALLHLYSPEIAAAGAQYLSVLNEVGGANGGRPLLIEGARRRLENLNVSQEVVTEIERTRKVPMSMVWTAPRDGVVLERNAIEGMRAPAGEVLFRIADISSVWVLADVPEHELGLIKPGQAVTIRVRSLPGRSFTGRVGLIYPQVNKETRTTRVRIELPNPEGVLLADMYADVEIGTGAAKPVVAVPDDAVIDTGERQIVILDKGEGRFEPREVKVGARGGGYIEVREGIQAGDQVVTSANFLIDAESNLKAALQGMAAAPPPAAPGEEKPQ